MTRTADPYDKLAAMFLTDGDRPDPDMPSTETGQIEIVIAGHLPVRGAIWLTPYAETIAQREGTTALVRLDGEEPTIEVRGGASAAGNHVSAAEARTVREAIMLLGPDIRTWIVRPASGAEPGELLGGAISADRITILSSADQAAITNVYKLVKELTTTARALDRQVPRLGLAMIGSPRERAAMQARRIDATAREHLDVSIPMTLNIAQMGSIRSTGLRTFPGQGRPPLDDVLAWINTARARTPGPAPAPTAPPAPPAAPPPVTPVAPLPAPAPINSASYLEDVVRGSPSTPATPATPPPAPPTQAPPSPPAVKLPPRAVTEVEPKHASLPREPDHAGQPVALAEHVTDTRARTLAGVAPPRLKPLVARCPGHERIEIALDASGRMHVLAREEDVRGLPVVQAWAHANRELIAMAHPGETFDPTGPTVAHVFATDPLRVADLHASPMHLHVLTPIDVDGKRAWYTAALNRPL